MSFFAGMEKLMLDENRGPDLKGYGSNRIKFKKLRENWRSCTHQIVYFKA